MHLPEAQAAKDVCRGVPTVRLSHHILSLLSPVVCLHPCPSVGTHGDQLIRSAAVVRQGSAALCGCQLCARQPCDGEWHQGMHPSMHVGIFLGPCNRYMHSAHSVADLCAVVCLLAENADDCGEQQLSLCKLWIPGWSSAACMPGWLILMIPDCLVGVQRRQKGVRACCV